MEDLTQRQIDILKTIIKEYTESGEAVGSEILEKKYKLGVSPATIRNEMVELAKKGYLKKTHFSSGRVPSAKGFRFYIKHLMKQKDLSTTDEVSYKNSIWDERSQLHKLLAQATKVLSHKTGLLSLAATDEGDVYYAGVSNLLNQPEFYDLNVSRNLFERLDEVNYWERILAEFDRIQEEIMYMLGEEDFRDPVFESCASVFGEFEGPKIKGIIGVVGPKRMYYDVIIPQIKYFSHLIGDIMSTQKIGE
jgi:heat-inducible transcriptional repressor